MIMKQRKDLTLLPSTIKLAQALVKQKRAKSVSSVVDMAVPLFSLYVEKTHYKPRIKLK